MNAATNRGLSAAALAWVQAVRDLDAAVAEVEGRPYSRNLSALLMSPMARQAQHAAGGGDPAVYAEDIELGRRLIHGVLTSRGDSPHEATRKVAALETAYATWQATPERTR